MTTIPSPDAKAVVRAAEALTTQVRRIADALTTPVVRYEVVADDGAPTPATTCSAQYHRFDPVRECIRAAHHDHQLHTDDSGFRWTEAAAVYPVHDGPFVTMHGARDMSPEAREALGVLADVAVRQMTEAPAADEGQTIRWARRESLLVLLTRLQRRRTLTEAEAGTLRHHVETEIREADTARSVAAGNKRHVQVMHAELAEAQQKAGDLAETYKLERRRGDALAEERNKAWAERDEAQAAIDRVRALHDRLAEATDLAYPADLITRAAAAKRIAAALDGTEQPTTKE